MAQSIERCEILIIGAGPIVGLENDFLSLWFRPIGSRETYRDRNGFVVESSGLNCRQRFLMTSQREFVGHLPRDIEPLR